DDVERVLRPDLRLRGALAELVAAEVEGAPARPERRLLAAARRGRPRLVGGEAEEPLVREAERLVAELAPDRVPAEEVGRLERRLADEDPEGALLERDDAEVAETRLGRAPFGELLPGLVAVVGRVEDEERPRLRADDERFAALRVARDRREARVLRARLELEEPRPRRHRRLGAERRQVDAREPPLERREGRVARLVRRERAREREDDRRRAGLAAELLAGRVHLVEAPRLAPAGVVDVVRPARAEPEAEHAERAAAL